MSLAAFTFRNPAELKGGPSPSRQSCHPIFFPQSVKTAASRRESNVDRYTLIA